MPPEKLDVHIIEDIKTALTKSRKPILLEACLDTILSQIDRYQIPATAFDELVRMFEGYFSRDVHDPLEGDPSDLHRYFDICHSDMIAFSNTKQSSLSKKSTSTTADNVLSLCCLPQPCLRLDGNRGLDLGAENSEKIKNIEYADAFWDWFIERTNIDTIGERILSDFEFGGKFPVRYDTPVGIISQVMINEINKGTNPNVKQRTGKSLKSIGMKLSNDYGGLNVSDIEISPGMIIGLQLVAKIANFYKYGKVIRDIKKTSGKAEQSANYCINTYLHESLEKGIGNI